jgi:hypothetical protein
MPTAELAALVVRAVNRTALEPDHCDHCDARIDGDHAATSDVCWDCWQTAKAAALTPGQRRVLEACAAFPTEHLTGDAYPSSSNRNELSDLSLRWSQAVLALRAEEGGA